MKLGRWVFLALAIMVWALFSPPLRAAARRTHRRSTRSVHRSPHSTAHHRSSSLRRGGKGRRSRVRTVSIRRPNAYTRLAHMELDPKRVENIQQALTGAGWFHGAPTGRWDSETHDAMARYQASNGFAVTGLPDSKSLMKLGLGPHPLPKELDKNRASSHSLDAPAPGAANPDPGASTSDTGSLQPAASPASADPPENNMPY